MIFKMKIIQDFVHSATQSAEHFSALSIRLAPRAPTPAFPRPANTSRTLNMSQSSTSVSVPQTTATTSSSDIEHIFDAALKSYKKKTKKDLKNHDLFKQLETCDSPAAILAMFQTAQFDTGSDDRLKRWLVPTLNVLCSFSDTLGEAVSLVVIDNFVPP
jgi:hypothetical protein